MDKQFTIKEFLGYVPFAGGQVETRDVVVPDGKWVVEVRTSMDEQVNRNWEDGSFEGVDVWEKKFSVVGWKLYNPYTLAQSSSHKEDENHRSAVYMLVADEPFGVITEELENGVRTGGLHFSCARQVHKGELARRPQITRPQFVRGTFDGINEISGRTNEPIPPRDRRRGKHGWARLSDVAELVGMSRGEMLSRYFAFTHAESPWLDVIIGGRGDIHGRKIAPGQIKSYNNPASHEAWAYELMTQEVWIRQGFALTILYLHYLGYVPPLPHEQVVAVGAQTVEPAPTTPVEAR